MEFSDKTTARCRPVRRQSLQLVRRVKGDDHTIIVVSISTEFMESLECGSVSRHLIFHVIIKVKVDNNCIECCWRLCHVNDEAICITTCTELY